MSTLTQDQIRTIDRLIDEYGAANMELAMRPVGAGMQVGFRCWLDDCRYRTRHAFSLRPSPAIDVLSQMYTEIEAHLNHALDAPKTAQADRFARRLARGM